MISVLPESLSFSSLAGSKVLIITSNTDWTVTDNADWLTVSSASGSNNGTLTVSVTRNTGVSRSGIIVVRGCDRSISINVQQDEITVQHIKDIQGIAYISPLNGTYQRIVGTVTGVIPGVGYFVQDAVEAFSGIYVADTYTFVLEGNGITVDGTVQEVNGVTTLNADHVQLVNPPVTITPVLMGAPADAKSEQYESVVVKVAGARFQGSPNQDGSWEIKTTETSKAIVNKLMFEYTPVDGHYYDVTGIVNGGNNYKIEPRKAADIIDLSVTTPSVVFEDPDIMVYPNPFTDYLSVSNSDKLTRLTITNITGQAQLDIMHPQPVIKTADLVSGIYIIRLYTDSGLIMTKKFVRK